MVPAGQWCSRPIKARGFDDIGFAGDGRKNIEAYSGAANANLKNGIGHAKFAGKYGRRLNRDSSLTGSKVKVRIMNVHYAENSVKRQSATPLRMAITQVKPVIIADRSYFSAVVKVNETPGHVPVGTAAHVDNRNRKVCERNTTDKIWCV